MKFFKLAGYLFSLPWVLAGENPKRISDDLFLSLQNPNVEQLSKKLSKNLYKMTKLEGFFIMIFRYFQVLAA